MASRRGVALQEPTVAFFTFGDLIVTGLTLLLGLKDVIAKFSWVCGLCQIGALFGLMLWFVFNSPVIAILAAIIIDFIAAIPTLRHSWLRPEEETYQTFLVLVFASTLTLISLDSFNVASLSFAIYLLFINAAIAGTVIYR